MIRRPKARLAKGFRDIEAGELRGLKRMLATIEEIYESYGFEPIETPAIEYTDALGKFLPDEDRPNEGVFSFQDDDEQWLSLRYDLTAPLARYVAENFDRLPKPYRSYRAGWVFRNEKPGPGRFRQFMQFDADTVGTPTVAADAEMCMLMADTLEKLGIERGDYVIRVNDRKVLDGVMELAGVTDERQRLTVLRAIDKLDRVGVDGVRQLLGAGRKDESGDFTKGAGLDGVAISQILKFVAFANTTTFPALPDSDASTDSVRRYLPGATKPIVYSHSAFVANLLGLFGVSPMAREGIEELREIGSLIAAAGYNDGRIVIDPSVVRGLEYYTGPVYEAELTFETVNEKGEKARFGSVAGGGRYDGLVARFRGQEVPATGFSIGVSRLQAALSALGKIEDKALMGPAVVLVMDRSEIATYQRMVAELREAGITAEMYFGTSGLKAQMKYADRRGSPCVVIQGADERESGEVQIKDLIEGARLAETIEGREQWRAERPAQVSVPEERMVEAVKDVLARHGAR